MGMNLFDFLAWAESHDPVLSKPEDYALVCRCAAFSRSMALAFGVQMSTCKYWKPYAEELLRQHEAS